MFDVVEDRVFVVINHLKNLSNMYLSDSSGVKYQLSLPRVLYHNPFTDVSSPWLRYELCSLQCPGHFAGYVCYRVLVSF